VNLFLHEHLNHILRQIKKQNVKEKQNMARLELTLNFPKSFQIKTFNVKSEKTLSPLAKLILQSVQFKHFYYVRDDISYLLKSNPVERDFLLQALYSTVISLQNNLSINFFDMWVYEIYINKVSTHNKFMNQKSQNIEPDEYITIKLAYGSSVSQEKK
jgi:hypothetical protein